MKITFAESAKADIAAFIVDEGDKLPEAAAALDKASGGLLSEALEGGRFALKESHPSPDAATVGFAVLPGAEGRRVWALVGPSAERAQPALLRLRLHRRIPFAIF